MRPLLFLCLSSLIVAMALPKQQQLNPCYPPPCPFMGPDYVPVPPSIFPAIPLPAPAPAPIQEPTPLLPVIDLPIVPTPPSPPIPVKPPVISPDIGFLINIPAAPPNVEPEIPDFPIKENCNECDLKFNIRQKSLLDDKIALKEKVIERYQDWLDLAHQALLRIEKQQKITKQSLDFLKRDHENMQKEKENIEKQIKQEKLEAELDSAKRDLAAIEKQREGMESADKALNAAKDQVVSDIKTVSAVKDDLAKPGAIPSAPSLKDPAFDLSTIPTLSSSSPTSPTSPPPQPPPVPTPTKS